MRIQCCHKKCQNREKINNKSYKVNSSDTTGNDVTPKTINHRYLEEYPLDTLASIFIHNKTSATTPDLNDKKYTKSK